MSSAYTPPSLAQHLKSIQGHFRSFRRRVLAVLIAFGLGTSLTWWYHKAVLMWLIAPAHGQLSASGLPIYTTPTEMFGLTARLAFIGGAVVTTPVLVYNIARLVRPLLNSRQTWGIDLLLPAIFGCYILGMVFAYFVLLPTGLGFLLQFGEGTATPMVNVTAYADLALAMIFGLGVVFELPLVMFLLARLGLISHQKYRKFRKYVPITAFSFSAFITPGFDIVTSLLIGVPLILLYEVGMVMAWIARPKQVKPRPVGARRAAELTDR